MKTFTKIAAKPAFAQNVQELVYDGRLFLPELGNSASYWAAFRARMIEELDIYEDHTRNANGRAEWYFAVEVYEDSIWNKGTLGAGEDKKRGIFGDPKEFYMNFADSFVRYVRLLDQQERILKNGTDFKALCKGLASFRNISKVGALVDFTHYSDYFLDEHDQYTGCHDWYSSQSKLEFGLTVPPSKWCRRPASMDGGQQDQEEHIKWDVRGVQNLFRALSTHCRSLTELRIGSMDYKAPMTIFQLSRIDTEKICTMFRGLTTLQIYPYIAKSDNHLDCAKQYYSLGRLLQETKELRVLSSSEWCLDEDPDGSEESDDGNEDHVWSERTDFGIFCGEVWPHLTKLKLEWASVKAGDLMSIVRAHRGSLRELSLTGISLLDEEGWEHFGKEMGQILELHYVWVRQLRYEITRETCGWWPSGEAGLALVRDLMQWALPDLLEIEDDNGTFTGKLKAGSP